jgi:hypothetical protein
MADYLPLIAKAIAGLEKNTGEARRALYDRARTALVAQLRGMNPPLSEADITRERLALEEAIRKVESEAARQVRSDLTRPPPAAPPPPPPPRLPPSAPRPPESRPAEPRQMPPPARPPAADNGLRNLRNAVQEAEALGDRAAEAGRVARDTLRQATDSAADVRVDPPLPGRPRREVPPPPPPPGPAGGDTIEARSPRAMRDEQDEAEAVQASLRRRGAARRVFVILLVLALIAGLAGAAWWQRDRLLALLGPQTTTVVTTPPPGPADPGKIDERVPGDGTRPTPVPGPGGQVAAVAQRVVLYEEDPADPQGRRMVGSVIWRTETASPGPGQPPETVVRADVDVPERRMAMTLSMRRNTDKTLPASHTVEVVFNLPADFPFGGISNVPGVLLKQAEQSRGAPLAGLVVKVTAGFFLIGLSSVEADKARNVQLLRERPWFDIPMVYNNGRRAILAIEKGTPGERVINDALTAWGN